MSMYGTNDEERTDLNKEESRYVRARSRRLLSSLLNPIKARIYVAILLGVISTALRVAGPALIALGIDWALPKAILSSVQRAVDCGRNLPVGSPGYVNSHLFILDAYGSAGTADAV